MTRLKDLDPGTFTGKEEEWPRWKDEIEDYAEAFQPGLKHALEMSADYIGVVTEKVFMDGGWAAEWPAIEQVYTLQKRKIVPNSEAR